MRDHPGQLFSKDAPPQRVAHGGAVTLEGSQWQACFESDCLVLRKASRTDDKKEQIVNRINNIKREVEGRQQELEALAVDFARVGEEAETVQSFLSFFFLCLYCRKLNLQLLICFLSFCFVTLFRATTPTALARSLLASVPPRATTRSDSPS